MKSENTQSRARVRVSSSRLLAQMNLSLKNSIFRDVRKKVRPFSPPPPSGHLIPRSSGERERKEREKTCDESQSGKARNAAAAAGNERNLFC